MIGYSVLAEVLDAGVNLPSPPTPYGGPVCRLAPQLRGCDK